eukprot:TRINITY_DN111337_c0_g2_i1.p1 TRINITY_DN111337_c0_g2~~TRINITY_DN111337_c0_g2_i1.p1  ORF type:complete len:125 (-),score=7.97 TRINITY_DN111337_c0_g2_i1:274-648(-)
MNDKEGVGVLLLLLLCMCSLCIGDNCSPLCILRCPCRLLCQSVCFVIVRFGHLLDLQVYFRYEPCNCIRLKLFDICFFFFIFNLPEGLIYELQVVFCNRQHCYVKTDVSITVACKRVRGNRRGS